jgi:hypothetical protein
MASSPERSRSSTQATPASPRAVAAIDGFHWCTPAGGVGSAATPSEKRLPPSVDRAT